MEDSVNYLLTAGDKRTFPLPTWADRQRVTKGIQQNMIDFTFLAVGEGFAPMAQNAEKTVIPSEAVQLRPG